MVRAVRSPDVFRVHPEGCPASFPRADFAPYPGTRCWASVWAPMGRGGQIALICRLEVIGARPWFHPHFINEEMEAQQVRETRPQPREN